MKSTPNAAAASLLLLVSWRTTTFPGRISKRKFSLRFAEREIKRLVASSPDLSVEPENSTIQEKIWLETVEHSARAIEVQISPADLRTCSF